jgi:hypothetical protein
LDLLARRHHNFFRLWTWELTKCRYDDGPFRYTGPHPWERVGPGTALDGKPRFDLHRLNPAYFSRLRERVLAARDQGIYVGIMLFEGHGIQFSAVPWCWDGHPFNVANNVNGIDGDPNRDGRGLEAHTLQISAITRIQEAYVRKVIDTVNDLDNVLYEISNEDHVGSLDWQYAMADFIHTYESTKPEQHPVGITTVIGFPRFRALPNVRAHVDWISPAIERYDDPTDPYWIDPPVSQSGMVELLDTDHMGPFESRTWVWRAFLRGYNPIVMDGPILDDPHPGPNRMEARIALGRARTFADRIDLASMVPSTEVSSTGYCLNHPGREVLVYQPAPGTFTVDLRAGTYHYEWFDPTSGQVAGSGTLTAQNDGARSFTPPFGGEAVLYLWQP